MNSPWAAGRLLYGVMVAAAVIMAVTAASPSPRGARAAQVTIDFRTTFQRMDGFGAAERVFDDPHVFNNFDPTTGRADKLR